MWAQVADVSCVLYPEFLCDILDEKLSLPKFSLAVSNNIANPQDPDCAIFYASSDLTDIFASATHAENPKVVPVDIFSKIWQIDSEMHNKQ